MSKKEHKWVAFYSPRNGRISIQACSMCGVAKGLVPNAYECTSTSENVKNIRLNGWTTTTRMQQRNVAVQQNNERFEPTERLSA